MSVYFNERRKWWEYYFRHKKKVYTKAGFKRKKEALAAEAERKKEVKEPQKEETETTDMDFLTLLNRRLDFLKAYRTKKHFEDSMYMARRWIQQWNGKSVGQIIPSMISNYHIDLKEKVSAYTANKELRALRAMWNFGIKPPNTWFTINPTDGIQFFPIEKKPKYVPPSEDIKKVLLVVDGEHQDYLLTIALTMGRMSEVNRLEWRDVDFQNNTVTLYSRKTKGGNLKPRKIPMTQTLNAVLQRRLKDNDTDWVFWHTYYSRKSGEWITGPFTDRKKMMTTLCKKAGVIYFRFHPLRHFGASILESEGVSIKTIQELLGHANRKTTEIYLHSFEGANQEAMNHLDSAFNGFESLADN